MAKPRRGAGAIAYCRLASDRSSRPSLLCGPVIVETVRVRRFVRWVWDDPGRLLVAVVVILVLVALTIAIFAVRFRSPPQGGAGADAAGQRVCHLILAKPFHVVMEDGVQAKQLRVDATRIGASRHWSRVASDLRAVLQALDPQHRNLRGWDSPSPRMIEDCRAAM
jgi:hypothetical protein